MPEANASQTKEPSSACAPRRVAGKKGAPPAWRRTFDVEKSPMDLKPPARRCVRGYYKTRTERHLASVVSVPNGTTTFTRWLTETQMQRTAALARWGLLYPLVQVTGEVTVELAILWEVPGATTDYTYATHTLPINQVARAVAWDGPTPGRVGYKLTFTNLGPATTAEVTIDVVAKRSGGNFPTGARLRDMPDDAARQAALPRFQPRIEGGRRLRRKRCKPGVELKETPAVRIAGPDEMLAGVVKSQAVFVPLCTPAASAADWEESDSDAWEEAPQSENTRYIVPDPEVVRAYERLGADLVLDPPGDSIPKVDFPPYNLIGELARPFYKFLGRCEGFDELWAEVTQGLEPGPDSPRFSRWGLADILSPSGNYWGSNGIDLSELTEEASNRGDNYWRWSVSAPWYEEPLAWYLVQMVSLLSDTFELLPDSVFSPREGGKPSAAALPSQIFHVNPHPTP